MIDVKNLHKSFGDHEVLKGVNEHIEKGEKVVSHRPVRLGQVHLSALPEPAGGAHRRHRSSLRAWTSPPRTRTSTRCASSMGMVFQQFNLFPHMTVHGEHHAGAGASSR